MADRHGPLKMCVADLGDREIRVTEAERASGGLRFPNHLVLPLPKTRADADSTPEDAVARTVAAAAKGSPYVSLVIGGPGTYVRLMNFSGIPGRMATLVNQVRQTLGVGSDFHVICRIVRQDENQYTLLASAIRDDIEEKIRKALAQRGFRPVSLVHRGVVLANLSALTARHSDCGPDFGMLYADGDSSLLVLRAGDELVLVRQLKEGLSCVFESLRKAYGLDDETAETLFHSGSFDITSQSKAFLANWVHQVELSLDFIERRFGRRIGTLYLCGTSLGANVLATPFREPLGRNVEVLPELDALPCPLQEGRLAEGHRAVSPFLLAATEATRLMTRGENGTV